MKTKSIIVYTFQSLEDPLVKGLILEYLLRLDENKIIYHLITHEQDEFKLSESEKIQKKIFLNSKNIIWYPVNYKNGKPLLLKKLFNFIQTFIICLKIKWNYRPSAILGFLAIAGSYSLIISKMLSLKLIIFCFEPHSEYMADFGIWKKSSLKYKLLRKFERLQLKHADYLVVPTSHSLNEANRINRSAKKYMVPISIDTDLFRFSSESRSHFREKINAKNKTVIIYTGKFGGIYYSAEQVISFFKKLYDHKSNYFLFIITPNVEEAQACLKNSGIPADSFFLSDAVPYTELHKYLSAADIGLIAVPNLPSQKYRTPVKTGMYLACGLPYIINSGVAEDDILANEQRIGVVVDDINTTDVVALDKELTVLFSEDPVELKKRCVRSAYEFKGIHNSVNALKEITNDLFRD